MIIIKRKYSHSWKFLIKQWNTRISKIPEDQWNKKDRECVKKLWVCNAFNNAILFGDATNDPVTFSGLAVRGY